jgi:DNA-binding NtrC family response regulator
VDDYPDEEADGELLARGALSVLIQEFSDDSLQGTLSALRESLRQQAATHIARAGSGEDPSFEDFEARSGTMRAFLAIVRRVIKSDSSLLVAGETGVGKEWLARAIHAQGPRARFPFVAVHCAGLPETLLESELFGHEEGAFTGAVRARRGMFELAHGGTIFLDEIGDMPLSMQVKFLRVLQDHRIQRLGSERSVSVDVRVIAASHQDLPFLVSRDLFRRDLYYRLAVVTLTVPPLRERREDIPGLVFSNLAQFSRRLSSGGLEISPAALSLLEHYDWPGNVRELINVLERAVLLASGPSIEVQDLPADLARGALPAPVRLQATPEAPVKSPEWLSQTLPVLRAAAIEELERSYLRGQLEATGGKIGATARRAGIEPRSLYAKMKRYGLDKRDFRRAGRLTPQG